MKRMFLLIVGAWALAFLAGCKGRPFTLVSTYRTGEISVDGDASDWDDALQSLNKVKLECGIRNDGHFLYICLKPDRRIMRQAIMAGFTVWFDSIASHKKTFGIQFPMGMQNMDKSRAFEGWRRDSDGQEMKRQWEGMLQEIGVIGPGEVSTDRLPAKNKYGIQAAIGGLPSNPVYELKIPLKEGAEEPYAVGTVPGAVIGVGFESGKFKRPSMSERPDDRGTAGDGSMGGGMGMGRGRKRGMHPPGAGWDGTVEEGSNRYESLDVWINVRLANPQPE